MTIMELAEQISSYAAKQDKRFDNLQVYMDKRFDKMDKRFDKMDKRFDKMDKRLYNLEELVRGLYEHRDETLVRLEDQEKQMAAISGLINPGK